MFYNLHDVFSQRIDLFAISSIEESFLQLAQCRPNFLNLFDHSYRLSFMVFCISSKLIESGLLGPYFYNIRDVYFFRL